MLRRPRLGVLTIGQAPRNDTVPHLLPLLGDVEVVERGALDGLGRPELAGASPQPHDPHAQPLVTRLVDGSEVVVEKRWLLPRMQAAIDDVEAAGVDANLLICTGAFPTFDHTVPLLFADRLLLGGVSAIAADAPVAVLCPLASQEAMTKERWGRVVNLVAVASVSPYGDRAAVASVARELAGRDAAFVVLDCIGFDEDHRRIVTERAGATTLVARSIVARLAAEVVAA